MYQHNSDQMNLITNLIPVCVPYSEKHRKINCHTQMFITHLPQRGYNDDIKSTHMQPANLF